jgi:hypothetical protein
MEQCVHHLLGQVFQHLQVHPVNLDQLKRGKALEEYLARWQSLFLEVGLVLRLTNYLLKISDDRLQKQIQLPQK